MTINKNLLLGIAIGGVTAAAIYFVEKKLEDKNDIQPEVSDEGATGDESETPAAETEPTVKEKIKAYAMKVADWVVAHRDYLDGATVCLSLASAGYSFVKMLKPEPKPVVERSVVADVLKSRSDLIEELRDETRDTTIDDLCNDVITNGPTYFTNRRAGKRVEVREVSMTEAV